MWPFPDMFQWLRNLFSSDSKELVALPTCSDQDVSDPNLLYYSIHKIVGYILQAFLDNNLGRTIKPRQNMLLNSPGRTSLLIESKILGSHEHE
jgi:hypothetical protein